MVAWASVEGSEDPSSEDRFGGGPLEGDMMGFGCITIESQIEVGDIYYFAGKLRAMMSWCMSYSCHHFTPPARLERRSQV